jgi:hypothetical protein
MVARISHAVAWSEVQLPSRPWATRPLVNAHMNSTRQSRITAQEVSRTDTQTRMPPTAARLRQRDEHKATGLQLGMRQHEASSLATLGPPTDNPATKVQDIEVEWPRPPMAIRAPSRRPLDPLQKAQQFARPHRTIDAHDRIHENRLAGLS